MTTATACGPGSRPAKVVIEFCRTMQEFGARAGRDTAGAADLENALGVARDMSRMPDSPQPPDAVTITAQIARYSTPAISILMKEDQQ